MVESIIKVEANYYVKEEFLELKKSSEELIKVLEKYQQVEEDEVINNLKRFLKGVYLVLEEKECNEKDLDAIDSYNSKYFHSYAGMLTIIISMMSMIWKKLIKLMMK